MVLSKNLSESLNFTNRRKWLPYYQHKHFCMGIENHLEMSLLPLAVLGVRRFFNWFFVFWVFVFNFRPGVPMPLASFNFWTWYIYFLRSNEDQRSNSSSGRLFWSNYHLTLFWENGWPIDLLSLVNCTI